MVRPLRCRVRSCVQAAVDSYIENVFQSDFKDACAFALSTLTDGGTAGAIPGNGKNGTCVRAEPLIVAGDPAGAVVSATCTDPPLSTCPNLF